MRRRRPHRPATLLVVLVVLHFTRLPSVAGRFRGADHKPIPTVGDDGPVRSVPAGSSLELGAANGGGGRRKTVKRTKGGLLPWWVRKRLQEHSEPDQKGTSTVQQNPVKAKNKTPNILEVVELEPNEWELEVAEDTRPAKSAAILVEDIPLEAGSWEAEKVATLQNELQTLNDVAHQEELQRGHAAEANLVSRAAELQDELSSLGDAVAEEGQGGAAQVDLLRSEGHDSTEGEMSLMDVAAEGAAKQRAAAKGKAGKGPRKGAGGKIGSLKVGKAKGKAAKLAAASVQKTNTKRKNAKVRKSTPGTTGREDYDES